MGAFLVSLRVLSLSVFEAFCTELVEKYSYGNGYLPSLFGKGNIAKISTIYYLCSRYPSVFLLAERNISDCR